MIILNREQFMKMPKGTVFSYYQPCFFEGLYIKDTGHEKDYPDFSMSCMIGAVENDSSEQFAERCERMAGGESFPVDFEFSGREGLFDDKLMYAVYEKVDVKKLIDRLKEVEG